MTIKLKLNNTVYYDSTGTNGFNLYDGSTISVAGRKNHILSVAIQVYWYSTNATAPTRVLQVRKPDMSLVSLNEQIGDLAWWYNAEAHYYEGHYIGVLDISDLEELNRIRFSSSKNFFRLGAAYYWMLDARTSPTCRYQEFYSNEYSFTDNSQRQGCVQISANWKGMDQVVNTIPTSDCNGTYAGHFRRTLTVRGDIEGGMHYQGWQTFRAVCAFYEPVYYGRPMVI